MGRSGGGKYLTTFAGEPRIGDIRISASGHTAASASVVGMQRPFVRFHTQWENVTHDLFTFGDWPPEVFDMWGRKTAWLERIKGDVLTRSAFEELMQEENLGF